MPAAGPLTPSPLRRKGVLSDGTLKLNRIEYDETIPPLETALPHQVDIMRKMLLDFDEVIHKDHREEIEHECRWHGHTPQADTSPNLPQFLPPDSAWWGEKFLDRDQNLREQQANDFNRCKETAGKVSGCQRQPEREYLSLLSDSIFCDFYNVFECPTREDRLFVRWRRLIDAQWADDEKHSLDHTGTEYLTAPKPDITYAFPIYGPKHGGKEDISRGLRGLECAQNFHLDVLSKLQEANKDLRLSLTNWLKHRRPEWTINDHSCFPWAVVEVKAFPANDNKRKECYRQAANASAKALKVRLDLFRAANGSLLDVHLPPIIAITCVGPELKVWLTYMEPDGTRRMICIWSTSLMLVWGVYATKIIVGRMIVFANHVLKPKICYRLSAMITPLLDASGTGSDGVAATEGFDTDGHVLDSEDDINNCDLTPSRTPFMCGHPRNKIAQNVTPEHQRRSSSQKPSFGAELTDPRPLVQQLTQPVAPATASSRGFSSDECAQDKRDSGDFPGGTEGLASPLSCKQPRCQTHSPFAPSGTTTQKLVPQYRFGEPQNLLPFRPKSESPTSQHDLTKLSVPQASSARPSSVGAVKGIFDFVPSMDTRPWNAVPEIFGTATMTTEQPTQRDRDQQERFATHGLFGKPPHPHAAQPEGLRQCYNDQAHNEDVSVEENDWITTDDERDDDPKQRDRLADQAPQSRIARPHEHNYHIYRIDEKRVSFEATDYHSTDDEDDDDPEDLNYEPSSEADSEADPAQSLGFLESDNDSDLSCVEISAWKFRYGNRNKNRNKSSPGAHDESSVDYSYDEGSASDDWD